MKTYKVLFLPHNIEIALNEKENLIRAALAAGVHINVSCGGEGVCGKCRVIIEQGEVEGGISEKLTQEDIKKGYRQACQSFPKSDLVIRVPTASAIDASVLKSKAVPRNTVDIKQLNFEELKEKGLFVPPVEKKYLELSEPHARDNIPDVTRVVNFLKQNHHESKLEVDLSVIRKIPEVLRKDNFKATVTLARPVRKGGKTRIINVQPGNTSSRNYAIAMDIGTTTVYGLLLDLFTGKVLSWTADFNGQISYGEDVISRIMYAEKPGGMETLQQVVVKTANTIIKTIIKRAGIDPDEISTITLAGNTTMTQLLLKVNPSFIRRSPYVPASTLYPPIKAVELGFDLNDHVTALVYPVVSSYVGGDIVAGVMGSGMYLDEELTLFMDIGTNAEIVIGNKDWLACAACSAGPAFEGGGITFGMRAAKGAIEDFSMDPLTYEPMNITIGNVRPKGICGSGLINIVATMFELGVINNSGKFNRDLDTPRIREVNNVWEYVLVWKDETTIDRDIVLTEPDINNLIRAKGAMYGGYMTLD